MGYFTPVFASYVGRTIFYAQPNGSNSIYASDIYGYNAATNVYDRHPNGNNSTEGSACPSSHYPADTGTGRERTIAANGYVWPADRHPEQTCYDTTRHAYWVWGGVCEQYFEDPPVGTAAEIDRIWKLDLSGAAISNGTWQRLPVTRHPGTIQGGEMVYSPDDDVIFMFGHTAGNNWVFAPVDSGGLTAKQTAAGCTLANDWTEVSPVGGIEPPAVAYPGLWYETVTKKVILFGGSNQGGTVYNETWAYDIPTKTWTNKNPPNSPPVFIATGGNAPQPPMAYDSVRHAFLYRQFTNTGALQDWRYDPVTNAWAAIASNAGPDPDTPVDSCLMAYDSLQRKFVAMVYNPASLSANHPSIWLGDWE